MPYKDGQKKHFLRLVAYLPLKQESLINAFNLSLKRHCLPPSAWLREATIEKLIRDGYLPKDYDKEE